MLTGSEAGQWRLGGVSSLRLAWLTRPPPFRADPRQEYQTNLNLISEILGFKSKEKTWKLLSSCFSYFRCFNPVSHFTLHYSTITTRGRGTQYTIVAGRARLGLAFPLSVHSVAIIQSQAFPHISFSTNLQS